MGHKNYMNHKINILQFCTTLFMIIFAPFLGIGLYNVLKISKIDTPISIIIAYFKTKKNRH